MRQKGGESNPFDPKKRARNTNNYDFNQFIRKSLDNQVLYIDINDHYHQTPKNQYHPDYYPCTKQQIRMLVCAEAFSVSTIQTPRTKPD